ncbi:hypothetical protein MYSTI_07065 [Myxococcus stipitatus DSM 14675]|uniref:Uncharacterized protein n=1 Tax=Myxococcus stipitatus (strain DSM 14675 / JCM 12634 / Mx s8) TaxID=1278073 RepID=L7ULD8_MYXSD|nr:hypothetical protein [Myxococcus stipitatus]AGC48337.1 hypothetical protein MYSTI_07065 [Myxococcus stipitatus DSM 14675]
MILPTHWDKLTATLFAVDFNGNPEEAWRFLAYQGLVEDTPGGLEFFQDFIARNRGRDLETGQTPVGNLASALLSERLVVLESLPKDPSGRSSKRSFRLWSRRSAVAA